MSGVICTNTNQSQNVTIVINVNCIALKVKRASFIIIKHIEELSQRSNIESLLISVSIMFWLSYTRKSSDHNNSAAGKG